MFDSNDHEPVLSQMEIQFLLSDHPFIIKNTPSSQQDESGDSTSDDKRETSTDNLYTPRGDSP